MYKNWDKLTKQQKRNIIEIITEKIVVSEQEVNITLNYILPSSPSLKKTANGSHGLYPTKIITVGDEVRTERLHRGMTQWEVDYFVGTYRGFFNELEVGNRDNTIYVLYKAYLFLCHIPKTFNTDEKTPRECMLIELKRA